MGIDNQGREVLLAASDPVGILYLGILDDREKFYSLCLALEIDTIEVACLGIIRHAGCIRIVSKGGLRDS